MAQLCISCPKFLSEEELDLTRDIISSSNVTMFPRRNGRSRGIVGDYDVLYSLIEERNRKVIEDSTQNVSYSHLACIFLENINMTGRCRALSNQPVLYIFLDPVMFENNVYCPGDAVIHAGRFNIHLLDSSEVNFLSLQLMDVDLSGKGKGKSQLA